MNDTRITSYALGELDAPEREIFEKELAASAEMQGELKEIIALAEQIPQSFEPSEGLTDEQRESLRARCADNRRALRREQAARRRMAISGIGALAAGIVVTAIVLSSHEQPPAARKELAQAPAVLPVKPAAKSPAATPLIAAVPLPAKPVGAPPAAPQSAPSTGQLLADADKFYKSGRFDLATKRYEMVLQSDAKNVEARKGLESIASTREHYAAAALDETRARTAWSVNQAWELPVAKFKGKSSDEGARDKFADGALTMSGIGNASPAQKTPLLGDIPLIGRLEPAPSTSETNRNFTGGAVAAAGTVELAKDGKPQDRITTVNGGSRDQLLALELPAATSAAPAMGGSSFGMAADSATRSTRLKQSEEAGAYDGNFAPVAPGTESYAATTANSFLETKANPLSTFSIDVDTASYANVRRFLTDGSLPPPDAVRIEELVNYFPYDYPQPEGDAPFSVNTEVSQAPWDPDHLLARVALKGRDIADGKLPASNLVFLIDVSGSMEPENKLPLLKRSLLELVKKISPQDQVAIVTYAGESGVALESTSGEDKARIQRAIKRLNAGGSTNGASGIRLAYDMAREHFIKGGNNRIILCTDGDFNVGVTSMDDLTKLIERERKSNIFLSVLGFGTGNLKDATMENLADKGNGNYAYIDTPSEGHKVLVDQMRANLFTIAKDVKIQVEFNPATVAGYRLIGYENRLLAKEDFNNDRKDAGEIGSGHTVTALYEIVPTGQPLPTSVDPLKYQTPETAPLDEVKTRNPVSRDLFTVKLRYKAPDGDKSRLIEKVVGPEAVAFDKAPQDFRFATAVAAFGMKLRGGSDDAELGWDEIQSIARGSLGDDPDAYRAEFLTLVKKAKELSRSDE